MGRSRSPRRDRAAEDQHFVRQKFLVEKHFPCFRCRCRRGVLECEGRITPSDLCSEYQVRIRYARGDYPRVRVVSPEILSSPDIHTFGDGTLCLYYPKDQPWGRMDNLHETIIPWTAEWLVFYELFLITGEWRGPAAPHGSEVKQPDAQSSS